MRLAHLGEKNHMFGVHLPSPFKGKHHKEENKERFRQIGKTLLGEKNPNWRGGISKKSHLDRTSLNYKLWRKDVFVRDHYTCLVCGKRGGELNAHHIKSFKDFPELRFESDNGITLCIECHYLEHGVKNVIK